MKKSAFFSQIRPFLGSPGCPKVLASFWTKTRPQGPKMKIFKKMKKHPQVFTQRTSISNFKQIQSFLDSPGWPEGLDQIGPKKGPQGPKIKILKK